MGKPSKKHAIFTPRVLRTSFGVVAACALAVGSASSAVFSPSAFAAEQQATSQTQQQASSQSEKATQPADQQADQQTPAQIHRIAGKTLLDTMQNLVKAAFPDKCDYAIVTTKEGYWDALSASSLAGKYNCPILLANYEDLPHQTVQELTRLGVKHVFVVGKNFEPLNSIYKQIHDAGAEATTIAGQMASDTANKVAEKAGHSDEAFLATSWGFQDALSASTLAYAQKKPIFLADYNTSSVDENTIASMKKIGVKKVTIIGGTAVVSADVENILKSHGIDAVRIAGETHYDTSKLFLKTFAQSAFNMETVGVATSWGYWDALTAAPYFGKKRAPILLHDSNNTTSLNDIDFSHTKNITAVGGNAVLSEQAMNRLLSPADSSDAGDGSFIKSVATTNIDPNSQKILDETNKLTGVRNTTTVAQVQKLIVDKVNSMLQFIADDYGWPEIKYNREQYGHCRVYMRELAEYAMHGTPIENKLNGIPLEMQATTLRLAVHYEAPYTISNHGLNKKRECYLINWFKLGRPSLGTITSFKLTNTPVTLDQNTTSQLQAHITSSTGKFVVYLLGARDDTPHFGPEIPLPGNGSTRHIQIGSKDNPYPIYLLVDIAAEE